MPPPEADEFVWVIEDAPEDQSEVEGTAYSMLRDYHRVGELMLRIRPQGPPNSGRVG